MLERVAARPARFFGKADILLAVTFLSGFRTALSLAFDADTDVSDRVIANRGWAFPRAHEAGTERQMLGKGMSPEQVIGELVAVEIEVIKRWVACDGPTTRAKTLADAHA
jgi:hypothetical protein